MIKFTILQPIPMSVPSVKDDLPHRLRFPIVDLLQFFWAQLLAQTTPVLVQLGRAQKAYRSLRKTEPLRWAGENKSAISVPLGNGPIGIMDVLQKKDRLVIPAEFGRIEVP